MKIVKIIVVTILVILGFVLIIGVMAPSEVKLERSITIEASAKSIFEEISGTKALNAWNPWSKIDPEIVNTFEGPDTGVGSKVTWMSDHPDVGNGSQEIIEMEENQKVRVRLFFDGYEEPSFADLTIAEGVDESQVVWSFEGDMGSNPIGKLFGLFMESLLGPSYEEGLQNLKTLVESKPTFSIEIGTEDVESMAYLGIADSFDMTQLETIGEKMGAAFGQIMGHMQKNNIEMAGPPFSVHKLISDSTWKAVISIPVSADVTEGSGNIELGATTGGKTVKAVHMGDYYKLGDTYKEAAKYMEYKNLTASGDAYEVYVTDPEVVTDTAQWQTIVYYPVN